MVDILGKITKVVNKGGALEIDLAEHRGMFKTAGKVTILLDEVAAADLAKHLTEVGTIQSKIKKMNSDLENSAVLIRFKSLKA